MEEEEEEGRALSHPVAWGVTEGREAGHFQTLWRLGVKL